MKAKHIFIALLTVCVLGLSSCMEQFAELNQNPSDVSTPNPAYLATRAELLFETNDYLLWFYNQALYTKWSQLGATGSYTEGTFGMGTAVHWQNTYITMLNYRNDIYNYIQAYEHPEMEAYAAMCGVLAVYGAIFSSDINGDIQYSEACQYKYGGSLTPNYDHVEDLYNTLGE